MGVNPALHLLQRSAARHVAPSCVAAAPARTALPPTVLSFQRSSTPEEVTIITALTSRSNTSESARRTAFDAAMQRCQAELAQHLPTTSSSSSGGDQLKSRAPDLMNTMPIASPIVNALVAALHSGPTTTGIEMDSTSTSLELGNDLGMKPTHPTPTPPVMDPQTLYRASIASRLPPSLQSAATTGVAVAVPPEAFQPSLDDGCLTVDTSGANSSVELTTSLSPATISKLQTMARAHYALDVPGPFDETNPMQTSNASGSTPSRSGTASPGYSSSAEKLLVEHVFVPPQVQQRFHTLLVAVCRVLNDHGIRHWVTGGTLLGCVRHRGMIPWDDDIDLCVCPNPGESDRDFDHRLRTALQFPYCAEYAPLFGYKVYSAEPLASLEPVAPQHDCDTSMDDYVKKLRSHCIFGVFVDLFVLRYSGSDGVGFYEQRNAEARSTWPKERWAVDDGSNGTVALEMSPFEAPIEIDECEGKRRPFMVPTPVQKWAYLDKMYGREWRSCGVVPQMAHGRALPCELRIPLTT